MLMSRLYEELSQLSETKTVHSYGGVLNREDSYVLRQMLDIELEGERRKGRYVRTRK